MPPCPQLPQIAVMALVSWLAACAGPSAVDGPAVTASASVDRPGQGATLGALLASEAGRLLDDRDRVLAGEAEHDALQFGQAGTAREWKNPASGRAGAVTPGPAYSVNQYTCRDYTHRLAVAAGKADLVRATACRQPDGSWRPIA